MNTSDLVAMLGGLAGSIFRFMAKANMTATSDKIDDLLEGEDDDDE
jgi:hypothetical protein